jgi:hypothetical protein
MYFRTQALLLLLVALTIPPHGPCSLTQKKGSYIALGIAGVTAAMNLMVYGPATQEAMTAVTHQGKLGFYAVRESPCDIGTTRANISGCLETRDATSRENKAEVSHEMLTRKHAFSRNHAMSIHLNLVTIAATLWYGWRLSSRLIL